MMSSADDNTKCCPSCCVYTKRLYSFALPIHSGFTPFINFCFSVRSSWCVRTLTLLIRSLFRRFIYLSSVCWFRLRFIFVFVSTRSWYTHFVPPLVLSTRSWFLRFIHFCCCLQLIYMFRPSCCACTQLIHKLASFLHQQADNAHVCLCLYAADTQVTTISVPIADNGHVCLCLDASHVHVYTIFVSVCSCTHFQFCYATFWRLLCQYALHVYVSTLCA
jgi:hypothetical protein